MNLYWLAKNSPPDAFPEVRLALDEPNGLLAAGGDLSPERLTAAYRRGIFPWFERGQPILWWSPDPRAVLFPTDIHISRSLQRTLRRGEMVTTFDRDFDAVVAGCASPRPGQDGTWITSEMKDAYSRLHELGHAHAVEVWRDNQLVGGIYGVSIGRVFYGESMFSRCTNASKVALIGLSCRLQAWNFGLIDCQLESAHLQTMGAVLLPRNDFIELNKRLVDSEPADTAWRREPDGLPLSAPAQLQ